MPGTPILFTSKINIPRVKGQHIFTKPMYFLKGEEEKEEKGGEGYKVCGKLLKVIREHVLSYHCSG